MQKINYQKKLDVILNNLQTKPKLLLHVCCGPCSSYVMEYLAEKFEITLLYYNPNIYPEAEYSRRKNELLDLLTKFPPALKNKISCVQDTYDPQEYFDAIKIKENPELAQEKEKGERCHRCYEFRLKKAYEFASKNHFDYFCTSLSISPFKDSEMINQIGMQLEGTDPYGMDDPVSTNTTGGTLDKVICADTTGGTLDGPTSTLTTNCALDDQACAPTTPNTLDGVCPPYPKWLPSDFKKNGGFKRSLEISEEYGMYRQTYCGCVYSYNDRKAYDEGRKNV